ncbi:MAG: DUF349 domain-containing protein, partial [Erysipelotrichia bacterium]|nr:DUF349 domain-containing protein [Erysipelotrichia bacterium]
MAVFGNKTYNKNCMQGRKNMNYDNRNEIEEDFDQDVQEREKLIEEAKQVDPEQDWNATMKTVSDLRRKWKRIESVGSAYEEDLTQKFDAALEILYAKRNEGYADVQKIKKELIARAKELSTSTDWKKVGDEMNELMNQWKAAGSAGRDPDDALWTEFNDAREAFFSSRKKNWEDRQAGFEGSKAVKQEIIAKAKQLEDSRDWKKTSDEFKQLMEQWRNAGSSGRADDDKLWEEFSASRNKFNDARTAHYDEVRAEWDEHYEVKNALKNQAEEIANARVYDRDQTAAMKELSVKWKTAGACDRVKDEELWKAFRAANDAY